MARKKRPTSYAPQQLVHPHAAGIDCGATAHFVAVPPDRDSQPVRSFETFTADLHALADWLAQCGIETVAVESTGVSWIPLFELLESRGVPTYLVDPGKLKHASRTQDRREELPVDSAAPQLWSSDRLVSPRGGYLPLAQLYAPA